jgi:PAS domain S-box-containing protein
MHESEEQYRILVEKSPLGIAVHRGGKLIYANQSALKIFGLEAADEYLGKSVMDFVHPDYQQIVSDRVKTMYLEKGAVEAVEEKWVRPDGRVIDVEVAASLITYQGAPAIQVMFSDITERKKTKEILQISEERFRVFAKNIKDIIWTVDLNMNFTYVSGSVESVLGYTSQELESRHISEFVPPESVEIIMAIMSEAIRLEQTVGKEGYEAPPFEIDIYHKNGALHRFEISRVFLRDDEDRPTGVLGVARDITDRKLAEEALEKAVARAEFYIDLMAHDLANMQQGITVSLELLLAEDRLSGPVSALAETALMQTRRATALIGNVKKLAATARDEIELSKQDPYDALTKAIEVTKNSVPEKHIAINTNLQEAEHEVIADEFLMDVFFNILHNAAKADVKGKTIIEVNVKPITKGTFLEMRFEDRGPGISDDLKEAVFSRMEERERRGSGLGLTLVRQIVNRYGGKVWIEDRIKGEQSHGTCVVLHIPKA